MNLTFTLPDEPADDSVDVLREQMRRLAVYNSDGPNNHGLHVTTSSPYEAYDQELIKAGMNEPLLLVWVSYADDDGNGSGDKTYSEVIFCRDLTSFERDPAMRGMFIKHNTWSEGVTILVKAMLQCLADHQHLLSEEERQTIEETIGLLDRPGMPKP